MDHQIVELTEVTVIGLGVDCPGFDVSGIGPTWDTFVQREGELPIGGRIWGVSLPRVNGFHYIAGNECPPDTAVPRGMELATIPAARYYCLPFFDHPSQMPAAFSSIFHSLAAASGKRIAAGPVCLEEYPDDWHDEVSGKFRCRLYVQLED
jgi:predicted transcriptional regulator YdeE